MRAGDNHNWTLDQLQTGVWYTLPVQVVDAECKVV